MDRKVYEYISKKTNDSIIEWKQCKNCLVSFPITQKDDEFYVKISPKFANKNCQIPRPTLCPDCRQQRRMAWRNDSILYKRKCDLTGKPIVSTFHKDHEFPVYSLKARFSDDRDRLQYGIDFDFNKTFFEQFDVLNQKVPKVALIYDNNENCDYTNGVGDSKNCYLLFGGTSCEDCMYGRIYESKNCVDGLILRDSDNCYECVDSSKLYNCKYCQDCNNGNYLEYCKHVDNSNNCFACVGLVNKQYCILNKQYSKEEYKTQLERIRKVSSKEIIKKLKELDYKMVKKNLSGFGNDNVIGNYCFNSKDCCFSFDIGDIEGGRYASYSTGNKDVMDVDYGEYSSLLYEACGFYKFSKSAFNSMNRPLSDNLFYCYMTYHNNHNCFGCSGLKNNEYCILNKQYTKEEYETLVPKIIQHMQTTEEWGEFFPIYISPYGYNETSAQEYYPMEREDAINKEYKRMDKEYPINIPEGMETIKANELDDTPLVKRGDGSYNDSILNKAIICEISGKPYRLVKAELEFYRKHGIAIPKRHPSIRNMDRLKQRPSRNLHLRKCDKCGVEMLSVYEKPLSPAKQDSSPHRGAYQTKVYCEKCYNKEIYG